MGPDLRTPCWLALLVGCAPPPVVVSIDQTTLDEAGVAWVGAYLRGVGGAFVEGSALFPVGDADPIQIVVGEGDAQAVGVTVVGYTADQLAGHPGAAVLAAHPLERSTAGQGRLPVPAVALQASSGGTLAVDDPSDALPLSASWVVTGCSPGTETLPLDVRCSTQLCEASLYTSGCFAQLQGDCGIGEIDGGAVLRRGSAPAR